MDALDNVFILFFYGVNSAPVVGVGLLFVNSALVSGVRVSIC